MYEIHSSQIVFMYEKLDISLLLPSIYSIRRRLLTFTEIFDILFFKTIASAAKMESELFLNCKFLANNFSPQTYRQLYRYD